MAIDLKTISSRRLPPPASVLARLSSRFQLSSLELELLVEAATRATGEEWRNARKDAAFRRTRGVLCHHLRTAGFEPPPKLQKAYSKTARATMLFEGELRRIAPLLRDAGVRVLLIKGSSLHDTVYQNPGLRPFEDSDWVFSTKEDATEAGRVLEALGYERSGDGDFPTWYRGKLVIDMHGNFLGDERVSARTSGIALNANDRVWERARSSPMGKPYWVPSPEDHLIILCAHLMKHSFAPGVWFTDIEGLLAKTPDFDWKAALSRAQSWGLIRPLAYTLFHFGAFKEEGDPLGALIPPEPRRVLTSANPTMVERFLLVLAASGGKLAGEKDEWEQVPIANLLWLSSLPGLRAKFRLLWEAVFPDHESMAEMYPSYQASRRWIFMVWRAGDLLRLGCRLISMVWTLRRSQSGRDQHPLDDRV